MPKDEKGRWIKGEPLTQEERDAISRGQIERHKRQRAQQDHFAIDRKRCTQCGEVKRVPDDYYMRKRKLKSGEINIYPPGECKDCSRARADAWKQKYIEEHGLEAWKEKERQWNRGRSPTKRRRYAREYSRLRRIEEGATPKGPWKKYENEVGMPMSKPKIGEGIVSAYPFRQWWEGLPAEMKMQLRQDPVLQRSIHRALNESLNISVDTLDNIAIALGDPGIVSLLTRGAA
jgi:hypothetical protein